MRSILLVLFNGISYHRLNYLTHIKRILSRIRYSGKSYKITSTLSLFDFKGFSIFGTNFVDCF